MGQDTGAFSALRVPIFDPKSGAVTYTWLKQFQQWQLQLSSGFDANGNLIGNIDPRVRIVGRLGTLGTILQHLSATGVIDSAGMTAATDTEQGAVILPTGATSNTLGTAATQPSTAFDAAGSATAAQTAAQTFATGAANTAQATAETFATSAVATAFAPGISVTIVTAKLTLAGADGSMTFTNGLLTAETPAT